jgi:hypothetical protein
VATYYQALVSADQLSQSREDAEQRAKSQAALVTYWLGSDGTMHLVNRSPDPVADVMVYVTVQRANPKTDSNGKWSYWSIAGRYAVPVTSIAPCAHLTLRPNDLLVDDAKHALSVPKGSLAKIGLLDFVDSKGVEWIRDDSGRLTRGEDGNTTQTFIDLSRKYTLQTALWKDMHAAGQAVGCDNAAS